MRRQVLGGSEPLQGERPSRESVQAQDRPGAIPTFKGQVERGFPAKSGHGGVMGKDRKTMKSGTTDPWEERVSRMRQCLGNQGHSSRDSTSSRASSYQPHT